MGKLMICVTHFLTLCALLLVLIAGLVGLPTLAFAQAGGEMKNSTAFGGYLMIQNGDAGPGKNGQSVILVAPKINNNQQPFPLSAFLNNVVTDHDCSVPGKDGKPEVSPCFLQVGFQFQKGLGVTH